MKHLKLTSRTLLGLALLGALTATPTMTRAARADAPGAANLNNDRDDQNDDRDNSGFGRDDKDDRDNSRRDDKGNRRDKRSHADFARRDESGPGFDRDKKTPDNDGRADFVQRGDRENGARFEGRDNQRISPGFGSYGRNRNQASALGRTGAGRPVQSRTIAPQFVGVVTKVKNDREFDVRIAGKTYNVYLVAPAGAIRAGQSVGLDGERIGNNDIRSARLLAPRGR